MNPSPVRSVQATAIVDSPLQRQSRRTRQSVLERRIAAALIQLVQRCRDPARTLLPGSGGKEEVRQRVLVDVPGGHVRNGPAGVRLVAVPVERSAGVLSATIRTRAGCAGVPIEEDLHTRNIGIQQRLHPAGRPVVEEVTREGRFQDVVAEEVSHRARQEWNALDSSRNARRLRYDRRHPVCCPVEVADRHRRVGRAPRSTNQNASRESSDGCEDTISTCRHRRRLGRRSQIVAPTLADIAALWVRPVLEQGEIVAAPRNQVWHAYSSVRLSPMPAAIPVSSDTSTDTECAIRRFWDAQTPMNSPALYQGWERIPVSPASLPRLSTVSDRGLDYAVLANTSAGRVADCNRQSTTFGRKRGNEAWGL